ncbi:flagellar hook-basal body complex protein [Bacillus sp. FJAT-49736]|uniref:flagellar hook protein FlgE n=1 Tax=Bacillus sp. FJAT-49736 TaxID=2833582 RepID=UPI001BC9E41C|nr:flagellar hook-basal body complex protein [Bacillus sp. FJAT-49736]MBS4172523.1 flagellar hook-basal body complex protein [Bacillus sp. FJAT-49736]
MLRSMYSGISGMKNFQTKLDVIGNNIANVNTYGFKKGRVTFKDTMNQTISGASAASGNLGGKNPMQVGLGSTLASIDIIDTQSSLQTTGRPLDLAIDGDGYFVVKQGNQTLYTRAGNFYLDNNGTLVNSDGFKVQQFVNGVLKDININVNSILPAKATTQIDIVGNIPNNANGATSNTQQVEVVDNNGVSHVLNMNIANQPAPNSDTWDITFADSTNPGVPLGKYQYSGGGLTTTTPLSLPYGGTQNVALDITKLTHGPDNLSAMGNPNGNLQGSLESFNIGSDGVINGVFSNGLNMSLGTLAIAKFSNPAGLQKAGNNTFISSVNSGTANVNTAGNGRGSIASGSLEMSNVDLSEEFTDMIVAQRGFQANTRIITTSDEILQELVNLKR